MGWVQVPRKEFSPLVYCIAMIVLKFNTWDSLVDGTARKSTSPTMTLGSKPQVVVLYIIYK